MASRYRVALSSGSPTSRFRCVPPCRRKPSITLLVSKRASPLRHFLRDTLSFPPSWPVPFGGEGGDGMDGVQGRPADPLVEPFLAPQSGGTSNMNRSKDGRARPSPSTASWSSAGTVVAFTDTCSGGAGQFGFLGWWERRRLLGGPKHTSAERFKMIRPQRFTWGTTATLDILRLGGPPSANSSVSVTRVTKPAFTSYSMSSHMSATFSGSKALTWGPAALAALTAARDQSGLQSVGTPHREYSTSVLYALAGRRCRARS
jgi:hypothetical protein